MNESGDSDLSVGISGLSSVNESTTCTNSYFPIYCRFDETYVVNV